MFLRHTTQVPKRDNDRSSRGSRARVFRSDGSSTRATARSIAGVIRASGCHRGCDRRMTRCERHCPPRLSHRCRHAWVSVRSSRFPFGTQPGSYESLALFPSPTSDPRLVPTDVALQAQFWPRSWLLSRRRVDHDPLVGRTTVQGSCPMWAVFLCPDLSAIRYPNVPSGFTLPSCE
jgi:hypothetical protein